MFSQNFSHKETQVPYLIPKTSESQSGINLSSSSTIKVVCKTMSRDWDIAQWKRACLASMYRACVRYLMLWLRSIPQ